MGFADLIALPRRRKIAAPRLYPRPVEGRVEADLDDFVLGPENVLANRGRSGMRYQADKPGDCLRVQLDISASALARRLRRAEGPLPKKAVIMSFPELFDPLPGECAFLADKAAAVQRRDIVPNLYGP